MHLDIWTSIIFCPPSPPMRAPLVVNQETRLAYSPGQKETLVSSLSQQSQGGILRGTHSSHRRGGNLRATNSSCRGGFSGGLSTVTGEGFSGGLTAVKGGGDSQGDSQPLQDVRLRV